MPARVAMRMPAPERLRCAAVSCRNTPRLVASSRITPRPSRVRERRRTTVPTMARLFPHFRAWRVPLYRALARRAMPAVS